MTNQTGLKEATKPASLRHTKIIGTLGPSSLDYETKKLVEADSISPA